MQRPFCAIRRGSRHACAMWLLQLQLKKCAAYGAKCFALPILIRGRQLCLKRYGYRRECYLLSACTWAEAPVPCSPQRPLAWSASQDRNTRLGATLSPNVAIDGRPLQWHSTWATERIYATQWLFYRHYRTILSGKAFSSCRTTIPPKYYDTKRKQIVEGFERAWHASCCILHRERKAVCL